MKFIEGSGEDGVLSTLSFILIYLFGPLDFYSFLLVLACVSSMYYQYLKAFAPCTIFFLAFTVRVGHCSIIPQPFCTLQLPFLPIIYNCNCIFHSFSCFFDPLKNIDTLPPWALALAETGHIAKRARARFPTSPRTRFRQRIRPLPLLPSSQLLSITIFPSSLSYHFSSSRRSIVFLSYSLFIHLSFQKHTITTPHQQ